MKSGETGYLKVLLEGLTEEALELTNSIIFSVKSKTALIKMEYPGAVQYVDGSFYIPLTQEDTEKLTGRYMVEAQINFIDRSVSKTDIYSGNVESTLNTEIVLSNGPRDLNADIVLHVEPVQIISAGGGTGDYNDLENKPRINGITLEGDKPLEALGIDEYIVAHKDELKGDTGDPGPVGPAGPQGIQGEQGASGVAGADGFSPSAKVERVADGAVITITDKSGTTTAKVKDGQGGSGGGGAAIDDDIVSPLYTWSSEKINGIKTDVERLVKTEKIPGKTEWVEQAIQIDPWSQLRDGTTSTASPNNISSKIAVKSGEKYLFTGSDGSSSKVPFLVGVTPEGAYTTVFYSGTPKTVHVDYEYTADGTYAYIAINSQANLSTIVVKKWEESEPVETTVIYTEMNPLRGKKLGVVGDSICAGNSYEGGYGKIIADNNGMTLQNLGVGGNSLTTNGSAIGADMDNLDWDNTQYYLKLGRNYTFTSPFISSTLCVPITRDIYYNGTGVYPTLYKYENDEMVAQPYTETKPVGNFYIKLPLPNPDGSMVDIYWRTGYESDWSIFEDFHSGFSTDATYNKLYTVEKSIAAKAEDFDADCDYILFEGGVNDYLFDRWMGEVTPNVASPIDTYTVLGAMEHWCRVMTRDYAGTKIGFLFIHNAVNKTDKLSYRNREHKAGYGTLEERFEAMKKVLNKYSIPYCDLFNESGMVCEFDAIRTTYTGNGGDGIHPNKAGYDTFYVPKITSFLKSL